MRRTRWSGKKQLVPVEAITRVDEDAVHISPDREQVAGGPAYDPDVVPEPPHYEDVYSYYEYPPFWGPYQPSRGRAGCAA